MMVDNTKLVPPGTECQLLCEADQSNVVESIYGKLTCSMLDDGKLFWSDENMNPHDISNIPIEDLCKESNKKKFVYIVKDCDCVANSE